MNYGRDILEGNMKRLITLAFLILMCFMIAACGKKVPEPEGENGGYTDAWKKTGFRYSDKVEFMGDKEFPYHEADCIIFSEFDPGFIYTEHYATETYLGQYRYVFHSYNTDAGWVHYMVTESPKLKKPTSTELLSGEKINGRMLFADGVKESDIAVLIGTEEQGEISAAYVMHFDEQGKLLSREEVSQDYKVKLDDPRNDWWCDEQGYGYLLSNEGKKLTVRKQDGEEIYSSECTGQDAFIATAFHTPNGDIIFVENDMGNGSTGLFWIDTMKQKRKDLAGINTPNLYQFTMLGDGKVLFTRENVLFRWDTMTGEKTPLFRYLGSTLPDPYGTFECTEYISPGEDEEIYAYVNRNGERQMYILSGKEEEENEECIRMMDMIGGDSFVSSAVQRFNYLDKGVKIKYKSGYGEDLWNRVMAEFALGKGPDMIVIPSSDEHLQILYDKGLLANLREYVSADTLEHIFPGVLESGTVNNTLVGLGAQADSLMLMVSNHIWEGNEWTTEDIIGILEQHPEMEGLIADDFLGPNIYFNLRFLVGSHLENSPFINWENRTCNFDIPLFVKALEYAKKLKGKKQQKEDIPSLLSEGKYLVGNIREMHYMYGYLEASLGGRGRYHIIGMAGQQGYSGYWTQTDMILVNRNTKYPETVAEFLEFLVDKETQNKDTYFYPVRRDLIHRQINLHNYDDSMTKEDIEFLMKGFDSLGPTPYKENPVERIIQEEAESYFNGTRTAEDVAKIINNRVQLYLNE